MTPLKTHLVDETLIVTADGDEFARVLGDYETEAEAMAARASPIVRAVNNHATLLSMLAECADFIEKFADVDGSSDGEHPNEAASLLAEVNRVIEGAGR